MDNFIVKRAIKKQKLLSRKRLAKIKINAGERCSQEKIIAETKFLGYNFKKVQSLKALAKVVHNTIHDAGVAIEDCNKCAEITNEDSYLPRFGNLIQVLEDETKKEKQDLEGKNMPSQKDLLRWALKDAVLAYYQGLSLPSDFVVVDSKYDNRLKTEIAPNFSAIAKIWKAKLDDLNRKENKFKLTEYELSSIDEDLAGEMQGSAFEKRLDRYRDEFMKKLINI